MTADFELEKRKIIHKWAAWSLVEAEFSDPLGERFTRTFVDSPGAVGVVALVGDAGERSVVLVRQYRPAFSGYSLELPAGMRDQKGEDHELTARRELEEEAGYKAGRMLKIGRHLSAVGISNSEVNLFLAVDLVKTKVDRHGPEEQFMTIETPLFTDALEMIKTGEISDGKTLVGLLLVAQNFSQYL